MKQLTVIVTLLALAACDSAPPLAVTRRGGLDLASCPNVSYLCVMGGSRVFVEALMGGGYSIVDVADPMAPSWSVQNVPGLPCRSAVFSGEVGYLAGYSAIRVVRFPASGSPQERDSLRFRAEAVALDGSLLFAAAGDSFCIADAGDPEAPQVVARVGLPAVSDKSGVSCIAADSGRLFIARWVSTADHPRLYLYDVAAPASPTLLDSLALDGTAWGAPAAARFRGDYVLFANAYGLFTAQLTDGRLRLRITDSTDILQQYLGRSGAGHAAVSAFDVTGDYVICACRCSAQVAVMDVSNPRRPELVYSTADDSVPQGTISGVATSGKYFYVAVEGQSFWVYELP